MKKTAILSLINESMIKIELSKQEAYVGFGNLPNQSGIFVRLISRSGQPVQKLITEISNQLRNVDDKI